MLFLRSLFFSSTLLLVLSEQCNYAPVRVSARNIAMRGGAFLNSGHNYALRLRGGSDVKEPVTGILFPSEISVNGKTLSVTFSFKRPVFGEYFDEAFRVLIDGSSLALESAKRPFLAQ